jgi:lipoprotein-anchoring transpeptidase ErfK/SrfK
MIEQDPKTYKKWAGGMDGGANNPLGARALYLFQGGRDLCDKDYIDISRT